MNMKRWYTDADGVKPTHWEKPTPVSFVDHRSGPAPNRLNYGTAGLLREHFAFVVLLEEPEGEG